MIVIFEPDDRVYVEDNIDAGEFASDLVTLIRKEGNKWYVRNEMGDEGYVEEMYLSVR